MKKSLPLLLLFAIVISCNFDKPAIELNNEAKVIHVLSDNYKVSNILINETQGKNQLDSTYASVDFDVPLETVDLNNITTGKKFGLPFSEILNKENLIYKVVLKKTSDGSHDVRLISFETSEITSDRQSFSD
jgi:hypothetical protein